MWKSYLRNLQLVLILLYACGPAYADLDDAQLIKIATWNLYDFGGKFGGEAKSNDPTMLNAMSEVISQYDITFVQEIANFKDNVCTAGNVESFVNLCTTLGSNYTCRQTPVITGDPNCEAYGLIYKKELGLSNVTVESTDAIDSDPYIAQGTSTSSNKKVTRPPMKAVFTTPSGKKVTVFNFHAPYTLGSKRALTILSSQVQSMQNFVDSNVIVLGDLNAAGPALPGGLLANPTIFPSNVWFPVVGESDTTNSGGANYAYDRIMLNQSMNHTYIDFNINHTVPGSNVTAPNYMQRAYNRVYVGGLPDTNPSPQVKFLSDHQSVYAIFAFGGVSPTDSSGTPKFVFLERSPQGKCTSPSSIFFRANNFQAGKRIDVYVVPNFDTSKITNLPVGEKITTANASNPGVWQVGHIANQFLFAPVYTDGAVEVLTLDLDRDGTYNPSVDLTSKFRIEKCIPAVPNDSLVMTSNLSVKRKFVHVAGQTIDSIRIKTGFTTNGQLMYQKVGSREVAVAPASTDVDGAGVSGVPSLSPGLYNATYSYTDSVGSAHAIVDDADSAGFIVIAGTTATSKIKSVGDDGHERERYSTSLANYIYAFGTGMSPGLTANLHILSRKLALDLHPSWNGRWKDLPSGFHLSSISVPIDCLQPTQTQQNCEYPSPSAALYRAIESDDGGNWFVPVWLTPRVAYNHGSSSNFQVKYGNDFNVLVDVDRNGTFDASDILDVHEYDKIQAWFDASASNDYLGRSSSDDAVTSAAIRQLKEILNGKLNLLPKLDAESSAFNNEVRKRTQQMLCEGYLSRKTLPALISAAQIGFRVSNPDEYLRDNTFQNGSILGDSIALQNSTIAPGAYTCLSSKTSAKIAGISIPEGASVAVLATNRVDLSGTVGVNGSLQISPATPSHTSTPNNHRVTIIADEGEDEPSDSAYFLKISAPTRFTYY